MTADRLRSARRRHAWICVALLGWLSAACAATTPPEAALPDAAAGGRATYIDTHAHLDGRISPMATDYEGAVSVALETMNRLGIRKTLVLPPPFSSGHPHQYDFEDFLAAIGRHPARFGFLGGGGSLNVMIQDAVRAGAVGPEARRRLEARAAEIVRAGAAGLGEITTEHLSLGPGHPYETAPPDHPLLLALADVAARLDVPVDLHMEAVAADMPLPPRLFSPPNPPALRENIAAFERLLGHNRRARIVWAHAGWDNTGHRTLALSRRLLAAHPNLFMSLKIGRESLPDTRPMAGDAIRPEWVELIRAFPDRFVIGSDQFHASPRSPQRWPRSAEGPRRLLDQLPDDVARLVAEDNAIRIYRLRDETRS